MIYFLIGYMASGKTTIGNKLEKRFNASCIDTDTILETALDLPISDIFNLKGEDFFREQEKKLIMSIISDHRLNPRKNIIVSCGGGTPIYNNLIDIMNKNGITIYIKCSPELILSRLSEDEINKRPLLKNKTKDELLNTIKLDIQEREKIYNKSVIIINYENINIEWP